MKEEDQRKCNQAEKQYSYLNNYSHYKDYIIYRLEPEERQGRSFLDLFLTLWVYKEQGDGAILEFPISGLCIKKWGTTEERLMDLAKRNTPRLLPARIVSLSEVMGGARIRRGGKEWDRVYFLTNRTGRFGASVLAYEGVLKELADRLDADLFLVPLSVHQVLAVAREEGIEPESLLLLPLSDPPSRKEERMPQRVYCYNRKTGNLELAAKG